MVLNLSTPLQSNDLNIKSIKSTLLLSWIFHVNWWLWWLPWLVCNFSLKITMSHCQFYYVQFMPYCRCLHEKRISKKKSSNSIFELIWLLLIDVDSNVAKKIMNIPSCSMSFSRPSQTHSQSITSTWGFSHARTVGKKFNLLLIFRFFPFSK